MSYCDFEFDTDSCDELHQIIRKWSKKGYERISYELEASAYHIWGHLKAITSTLPNLKSELKIYYP